MRAGALVTDDGRPAPAGLVVRAAGECTELNMLSHAFESWCESQ